MTEQQMAESIARIRRAVTSGYLKKSRLAELAGVSIDVLARVDQEDWSPQMESVVKLCGALDQIAEKLAA